MPTIKKKENPRKWVSSKQRKEDQYWGNKEDQEFYRSKLWRAIRTNVLTREPLCRYCKYEGKYKTATIVDHIKPIRLGGSPTDNNNLQPLCVKHHNSKSYYEGKGLIDNITIQLYGNDYNVKGYINNA